jgi:hypothetical protein
MMKIEKDPTCRWCHRQGQFSEQPIAVFNVCTECQAIQDPVLRFGNVDQSFEVYHNPDNTIYFEVTKLMGKSVRYTVRPEVLKSHGLYMEAMEPLNGKKYGG